LKNVSFDKTAREQIEKENYIPKIIDLLKVPNFRFVSLVLLYMLSLDDKIRNTFAYSDCMTLVRNIMMTASSSKSSVFVSVIYYFQGNQTHRSFPRVACRKGTCILGD